MKIACSVATIFSKYLGREIYYGGDDLETWAKRAQHMMPEWMVNNLRIMYDYFQRYGLLASPQDFTDQYRVLGREPQSFNNFVAEIVPIWEREISDAPSQ